MNKMIGCRIKKRRKELGLTQVQIKELTGISNGNLSDLENGNRLPSATALIELSKVLNVTTDWILTGNYPDTDIHSSQSGYSLSASEESLINCFKRLSPDDQDEIITLINLKIQRKERQRKSLNSETDPATIIA